jgi:GH43 family beta-xylosidase
MKPSGEQARPPDPQVLTPLIRQRADPYIHRHADGWYYFTASVPAYDGIELRRSHTIVGLADAEPLMVWRKPDQGPYSDLVWAPEIHFNRGAWYVYFAAAPSREIRDELFQHRMYALSTLAENPLQGEWTFEGRIDTGMDTFCLDATTFEHRGVLYYLWAQKAPGIRGNSNLYIAPMQDPVTLGGEPVRLSVPEYDWETRGFWVNEGPAVVRHGHRLFVTYSASATDANYAMGLLWADAEADLLEPDNWTKSDKPVLTSSPRYRIFGPGHNSFTVAEDGVTDLLVYHARTYTEIEGDPLWNPDRHTFVKPLRWDDDGMPVFGDAGLAD